MDFKNYTPPEAYIILGLGLAIIVFVILQAVF